MLAMTNEQIEQLSEDFQKQMANLTDVEFVNAPFAGFKYEDGDISEYRQNVSSQLLKIMNPENLGEFNSLISQALINLEKNEHWQGINHPKEQFDVKNVELCLPEKRAGRCFCAKMNDRNYKDVVTINPIAYTQWIKDTFKTENIENIKREDLVTFTEALIIHELTHGDQFNRLSKDDIPTDNMPSLIPQESFSNHGTDNSKKSELPTPENDPSAFYLMEALWEADTRSTACKCILEEEYASDEAKEKVIQMQIRGAKENNNIVKNAIKTKDQNNMFFEDLKNSTTGLKQIININLSEDVETIKKLIEHVYAVDKYGEDKKGFIQRIINTIKETNSKQMETVNKQSDNNQSNESVTNSETNGQSSETNQPIKDRINELKKRFVANNETTENKKNDNQKIKELRGISSFTKTPYKPKEIIVNPQTLRLYQDKMQNS